ncbi:MAG: hypothetical protein ACHQNA_09555 [Acidimicrobiales bacterium]
MSWLWSIPAAIAGVGVAVASVLAWRTEQEAAALRGDINRLVGLQPALVEARDEMASTALAVRRMHPGR